MYCYYDKIFCGGLWFLQVLLRKRPLGELYLVIIVWQPHSIHQDMMTSSNGNMFRVTGPLCGEFTGHRWIPLTKRPVTRSFDVFFHLCLNKRPSKKSWGLWFQAPSRSFWRHHIDWLYMRFCWVLWWFGTSHVYPYISARVTSLALRQSCDCPSANDVTVNDIDEYIN